MRTTINCRFLIKITLQFVPFFRARFHLFFFFYQVPNMHVFCSSGGEEAEAGRQAGSEYAKKGKIVE